MHRFVTHKTLGKAKGLPMTDCYASQGAITPRTDEHWTVALFLCSKAKIHKLSDC